METLVLCPEELCLGPVRLTASGIVGLTPTTSDFSIWTSGDVEKGTRFVPWKGTVRSDKLPVHDKLPEFDVSFFFLSLFLNTYSLPCFIFHLTFGTQGSFRCQFLGELTRFSLP